MNYQLQTLHFTASESFKELIGEKVKTLFIQNDKIISAHINLFKGAEGNQKNRFCEIELAVPGKNFFVKKNSEKYEASFIAAVDSLLKKMRRVKKQKLSGKKSVRLLI